MEYENVTFRKARIQEVNDIYAVLVKAFEPYKKRYSSGAFAATVLSVSDIRNRILGHEYEIFVVVVNKRVVGTVSVSKIGGGRLHIRSMAVCPEYQGKGVGLFMLEQIKEKAKRECVEMLSLDTSKPLKQAIGFYQKFGFEFTGVVQDFFGVEIFEMTKKVGGDI